MLRTLAKKALATLGIDIGELRRRSAPSYKLHQFIDRDGKFDYAKYRRVQNDANMKKIDFVWVQRENVYAIADYIRARGRSPKWGLCHGTRRGNEQAWFLRPWDAKSLAQISVTARPNSRTLSSTTFTRRASSGLVRPISYILIASITPMIRVRP